MSINEILGTSWNLLINMLTEYSSMMDTDKKEDSDISELQNVKGLVINKINKKE